MNLIDMIKEEQAASLEYKKLAGMVQYKINKKAFLEMSKDEAKHARMLKRML